MSVKDPDTRKSLKEFDARKLMEIAIEEMNKSVSEPRDDKVPPAVGAVIWFPEEKTYETAFRGELREGDHGEFTLLERKLGNTNLENCILFTTLEPCMKRNPPKVPCARRVTNARIKEVYVGISDPDVTVDGKGIDHLAKHRVVVHMFEPDLQEIIKEINASFIANANKRKREESEVSDKSKLEEEAPSVNWKLVSDEAVGVLHEAIEFEGKVDSKEFKELLGQLNMVDLESGNLTNNGAILFGENPRRSLPQTGVLATLELPDDTEEVEDFDGPQVLVPEKFLEWLKSKIPNPIDRSGASRSEVNKVFFELLREGLVNAIVHRNYEIGGAKIQVVVSPDSVVIKSPGGPFPPITLEQIQDFDSPMLSRNPVLHYVFNQLGLAEERGLGLKSMRTKAEKAGLPLPKYSFKDPYLVLTIYRSSEGAVSMLDERLLGKLSKSQRKGWEWLSKRGTTSRSEYAKAMDIGDRTAVTHLSNFRFITEVGAVVIR
jgi:ATP-dependent DNA helicase RecG